MSKTQSLFFFQDKTSFSGIGFWLYQLSCFFAAKQKNHYLYFQKNDMQGNADLYRYSISAQSSEAITSVSAQGKMKYANENIYIMDVEQIEVLSSTDTADIAYLPKSTISPGGSYKMSGFSASTTVAIAGPGSFIYGHQGSLYSRELDFKRYELKDHLGNARVVISDVKEPTDDDYDQFTADLQSYYNYYPFGMLQPKRYYTLAEEYKFGFNGMIMDNEITGGTGEHYDFGARIYSSRVGRWLSRDPFWRSFPSESHYSYAGNSPVLYIDKDGNFKIKISEEVKKQKPDLKIERFENIAKNMSSYAKSHPEIVGIVSNYTGLSHAQIKHDFKYGQGPTLKIIMPSENTGSLGATGVPYSAFKNGEILFGVQDVEALENASDEELAAYALGTISQILHEYTHYGDRVTNQGWITSASQNDSDNKVTTQSGRQGDSANKHWGSDVEQMFLDAYINRNNPNNESTRRMDGTFDVKELRRLRNSYRYNKKELENMTR